jgi:hypothetical protein
MNGIFDQLVEPVRLWHLLVVYALLAFQLNGLKKQIGAVGNLVVDIKVAMGGYYR